MTYKIAVAYQPGLLTKDDCRLYPDGVFAQAR